MTRTEFTSLRRRGRYLVNRGLLTPWSQYEQTAIVVALNTRPICGKAA